MPDNVTTLQGALMEPLSVAVHAVKQAKLYLDDVCVIFGAGTIGNMIGQVLKSIGCITVIQVDLSQKRLDIAKKTGADYVINASKVEDVVAEIAKIAGPGFYGPNGAGADVIFEAAAVPATVAQAIASVRNGGQIIAIALPRTEPTINLTAIVQKELTFQGSFIYTNEFEEAIALTSSGKVKLDDLITDIFPLGDIDKAFQRQLEADNSVKVCIKC